MPDTNFPNGVDIGSLKIGGVAVTATPAEINKLTGNAVTADDLTKLHSVIKTAAQINALPVVEQEAIADIATEDAAEATDAAPTKAEFDAVVALANANKAKINAILAALRAANIIAEEE